MDSREAIASGNETKQKGASVKVTSIKNSLSSKLLCRKGKFGCIFLLPANESANLLVFVICKVLSPLAFKKYLYWSPCCHS